MSSKKLNLMDQARELAEDIDIPIARLPSRAAIESAVTTVEHEQGREVVEETQETASVAEPEQASQHVEEDNAAKPTIVRRRPTTPAAPPARSQSAASSIDLLAREGPELLPLSCRVPARVRQELDRQVHELKSRGKKIKMEDVVTAALVSFLKIED
jgi:hypothetical protein